MAKSYIMAAERFHRSVLTEPTDVDALVGGTGRETVVILPVDVQSWCYNQVETMSTKLITVLLQLGVPETCVERKLLRAMAGTGVPNNSRLKTELVQTTARYREHRARSRAVQNKIAVPCPHRH